MSITTTPRLGLIKPDRQEPMPNWPWQNLLNSMKLDNKVKVQFLSYTPTLAGSVSDPDLGVGGAITGSYARLGNRLNIVYGRFQFGTSGINVGDGNYLFSLPSLPDVSIYNTQDEAAFDTIGSWMYKDDDTSGAQHMGAVFVTSSGEDTLTFTYGYGSGDHVGSANPFIPEINDAFSFYCIYQEAPV